MLRRVPRFRPQLRLKYEVASPLKQTYEVNKTRDMLAKYPGGSVDLIMDDKTGIATMTLNNPTKKNSMTGQMMLDFEKCVQKLENWESGKGLIFHGADGTFCTGGELNFVKQILTPMHGFYMSCFMHTIVSNLYQLPFLSVAVIEGNALGGGAELTTACDLRFMTKSAKIGFVQCKMGVTPGWAGGMLLTKRIGRKNALHLLYSGVLVDSENALKMNLVDEVIPDNDPIDYARNWLQEYLGTLSPIVSQSIKQVVCNTEESGVQLCLVKERAIVKKLWGGADQLKAIKKSIKHK
ncbi:hypothetical protein LOTGIDRAFT_116748 [Lottia gigantea]|uniref:Ethylmalonyl-CoA decarboxylase n=1 Tax=Lottia gigantea TaxID=225164 RepID=V4AFJ1_LOTGI|nr:hypothetical protein LOTGIDRAFT_116748 [Lottia gigantea]ESO95652.1 hypothetical protein LOTGIDRAFT_116748 [Lottia gigantea]